MALNFIHELKRRNVLRVGAAYVVVAWLIIQVAQTIFPLYGFGDTPARIVTTVLAIGLIPVLIFAWAFELTPEGLKRDADVDPALSIAPQTGKRLDRLIMLALVLALGYFAIDKFILDPARDVERIEAAREQGRVEAVLDQHAEKSVLVLPFENMSPDSDQEYFADGISEELLNVLAQIPQLRVLSRTTSFNFKGKEVELPKLAQLLHVSHVLEGSVRRSGDRVRITAQLIEASTDTHLWSRSYDRDMSDIFAVQDEIASEIASALVESFQGLTVKPADRTDNLAAASAYRTGRLLWWRRTPEDLQRAAEYFEEALQHDPTFAPAYAALADTWLVLPEYGNVSIAEARDKASPLIEKALELDPESAEVVAARGLLLVRLEQYDSAESALRHAIDLNENYIPAHVWLSVTLEIQGRYAEEKAVLEKAMELDPLNELLAVNYAQNLLNLGELEHAREMLQRLIAFRPDSTNVLRTLAGGEILYGNLVEGFRLAYRSYTLQPDDPLEISMLARAWAVLGAFDEAERLSAEGFQEHANSAALQNVYFFVLILNGRMEAAKSLVEDSQNGFDGDVPSVFGPRYNYQLGVLARLEGDFESAVSYFISAIYSDESGRYDALNIDALTLGAEALLRLGRAEEAKPLMARAERAIRRHRLSGVNIPDINYLEAVVLAINGEPDAAVMKLQEAYDAGFRNLWSLQIDPRIDTLRSHPGYVAIQNQIEDDLKSALREVRALDLSPV